MHFSKYFSPGSSYLEGVSSTEISEKDSRCCPSSTSSSSFRCSSLKWDLSRRCDVLSSNPSLLPEPVQQVLQEIRRKYGSKSGQTTNQTPSRNIYIKQEGRDQRPYPAPRRQLSFSELRSPEHQAKHIFLKPQQTSSDKQDSRIKQAIGRIATPPTPSTSPGSINPDLPLKPNKLSVSRGHDELQTAVLSGKQKQITSFYKGKKHISKDMTISTKDSSTTSSSPCQSHLLEVASMSNNQTYALERSLLAADEVACCLLYDDGSTQLRPAEKKKKRPHEERRLPEPCFICIALPWNNDNAADEEQTSQAKRTSIVFVKMSLRSSNQQLASWTRSLLERVMASSSRKICYDAQAMIKCLVDVFGLQSATDAVCKTWKCMDLKIAAWLLDPDHPPKAYSDVIAMSDLGLTFNKKEKNPDESICRDLTTLGPAIMTLFHRLKSNNLWDLFWNLEMSLCPILAVMEMQGINVDAQALLDASDILKKKIQMVEAEAHKVTGHPFLINSPQQLREVLFEELKLDQKCKKKLAKTNIKNFTSTSEAVLMQLQEFHPLPSLVLEYRQLTKLKSTYFDGILPFVKNGVLHTKWDQTAAATGRLTSTNPNLQSVPKQPITVSGVKNKYIVGKEDEVITIFPRDAYKSRDGWSFLAADFQSIELRLLASISNDPDLLRVFEDDACIDIFNKLTSQWLNIPIENVQFAERERTKRVVYSVIYGVGRERLANTLGVDADEAKGFMDSFLGRFPGINGFSRKCIDDCYKQGFVSTIFQRKRWIPHIKSHEFQTRSQAERQAVNFVVQGSAADLCKSSMIQIIHAINEDPTLQARLLLQIHDELLLEVLDKDIEKVTELVRSIMTSSARLCGERAVLKVPLPVTISVGKVWSQMRT